MTRPSGIYTRQSKPWQPGQVMLPPAPIASVDIAWNDHPCKTRQDALDLFDDIVAEDDSSDNNTRDDTDPCFHQPIPVAGYAFLTSACEDDDMILVVNDDWEACILSENEEASYVGRRYIDGTCCNVWYSSSWKGFIAQVMHGR